MNILSAEADKMSLRGKKATILPVELCEPDRGPESYDHWLYLVRNRMVPCFGTLHPTEVNDHDHIEFQVVNGVCVVADPDDDEYVPDSYWNHPDKEAFDCCF